MADEEEVRDLNDFLDMMQEASLIYNQTGDFGRAKAFRGGYWAIKNYLNGLETKMQGTQYFVTHDDLTADEDNRQNHIFKLKGIGQSIKQMLLEWAEDGECSRLDDLRDLEIDGARVKVDLAEPWFFNVPENELREYAFVDEE